jgi:hypothetical protein
LIIILGKQKWTNTSLLHWQAKNQLHKSMLIYKFKIILPTPSIMGTSTKCVEVFQLQLHHHCHNFSTTTSTTIIASFQLHNSTRIRNKKLCAINGYMNVWQTTKRFETLQFCIYLTSKLQNNEFLENKGDLLWWPFK